MAAGPLTFVAASHREAVRSALVACFGRAAVDAIAPLAAGASAGAILQVDVGGRRFVLRVEGARSPLRYPGQYTAMRMAAEAGLAPRVHYIDEAAGIAITDFIDRQPLTSWPGGVRGLVEAMGHLLARLHAAPLFPSFVPYPEIVARLFAHVGRTGLFAAGVLDPHVERLAQLGAAYTWDLSSPVSCHNDSLPSNVLFDGDRLWLVDWESAYPNDPLVDIAIQLDNLARSPDLEAVLIRAWLGRPPDPALRERLSQVRALNRLYYAGVLLSASALQPRDVPEHDLEVRINGPLTVHQRGKLYLRGFLTGDPVPGLPEQARDARAIG